MVLLFFVLFSNSYSMQGERVSSERLSHNLKISVSDIKYAGDNRYRITFLIKNKSSGILIIRKPAIAIYTQVNTGRWWEEIVTDYRKSFNPSDKVSFKPYETIDVPLTVRIPDIENSNLFINFEGDISIKIECEITSGNHSADIEMEEMYLWLRPKTDKWILREGM